MFYPKEKCILMAHLIYYKYYNQDNTVYISCMAGALTHDLSLSSHSSNVAIEAPISIWNNRIVI